MTHYYDSEDGRKWRSAGLRMAWRLSAEPHKELKAQQVSNVFFKEKSLINV